MKVRTFMAISLALLLLLSLSACGVDDNTGESKEQTGTSAVGDETTSIPEENQTTEPANDGNDIEDTTASQPATDKPTENLQAEYRSDAGGYFELVDEIRDKNGRQTYQTKDGEEIHVYSNGYFISSIADVYYLKDANGKVITSTEALDATGFGIPENATFLGDGYVFVYKITESYNGIKYQIGVINTQGEWIVPLSEENPLITSGMKCSTDEFINNLNYVGDGCLVVKVDLDDYRYRHCMYNIKTNQVYYYNTDQYYSNLDYMITEIEFDNGVSYGTYQGTMYEFHTNGALKIYNTTPAGTHASSRYGFYVEDGIVYTMISDGWGAVLISNEREIRNFRNENIKIADIAKLGNGTWLVTIKNDEGSSYYSIVNTKGEFLFEPIKTDATYILFENGIGVVTNGDYSQPDSGTKIVIDISGKVLYQNKNDYVKLYVKNGIVYETNSISWHDKINLYTRLR